MISIVRGRGASAMLRIARREVRRHRGRSALIVALIAVPVAVVACGLTTQATLLTTATELRAQHLGRADLVVGDPLDTQGGAPAAAGHSADIERAFRGFLPEGSSVAEASRTRVHAAASDRATTVVAMLTDPGQPTDRGMVRLDKGRLPARLGEIALTPATARELAVDLGDTVTLHPGSGPLEVVGFARATSARRESTVFVSPGVFAARAWLVDLPRGADVGAALARLRGHVAGETVVTATDALRRAGIEPVGLDPAWFMLGVLALAWTGVVAAATFAIGARSRLREVGLVAANGATRRQVSRLLLTDGLVLGLLGGVAGLLAGVGAAPAVVARMARDADRAAGGLAVPIVPAVGAAALGTVAALLAARWPAARAARLPTLSALQSRITRPPRRAGASVAGLLAITAGGLTLGYGGAEGAEAAILFGTMLVMGGVALLHRLLIDAVARIARRAPLAVRFAARDASRQATRTGPAVVAAMLAAALSIGAATIVSTAGARDAANPQLRGSLPTQRLEVGVRAFDQARGTAVPVGRIPDLERELLGTLGASRAGTIWSAAPADWTGTSKTGDGDIGGPPTVQVATPEALAILGVTDSASLAAFNRGAALRLDHEVVDSPASLPTGDGAERSVPVVDVRSGTVGVLGTVAVSPQLAKDLGLTVPTTMSLLIDLGRPTRSDDLARAHAAALRVVGDEFEVWAATGDEAGRRDTRRTTFIVAAIGLAIAIPVLGLVAALTRSEARAELAVLDAVGIGRRRRRRFAAASMGLLAAFAAMLALPAGLIPAVLYMRAVAQDVPGGSILSIPIGAIAAMSVGMPIALAIAGWLTAGRQRPLDAFRS